MDGERELIIAVIAKLETRIAFLHRVIYKLKLQLYRMRNGSEKAH